MQQPEKGHWGSRSKHRIVKRRYRYWNWNYSNHSTNSKLRPVLKNPLLENLQQGQTTRFSFLVEPARQRSTCKTANGKIRQTYSRYSAKRKTTKHHKIPAMFLHRHQSFEAACSDRVQGTGASMMLRHSSMHWLPKSTFRIKSAHSKALDIVSTKSDYVALNVSSKMTKYFKDLHGDSTLYMFR